MVNLSDIDWLTSRYQFVYISVIFAIYKHYNEIYDTAANIVKVS